MKQGAARRSSRSALLIALLLLALGFTGVLAYQALDAERTHRAAAERALNDYASFAAWQLNQQASQELLSAMISTFIVPLTRVNAYDPASWPSPADFRAASLQPPVPAKYMEGVRFFFRFDWRDSGMTVAGQTPSARVLKWVRDTVSRSPGRLETPPMRTQAFGSTDRNPAKQLGIIVTNDSYIAAIDSIDGRLRVVCYVISRDFEGRPLVTYGFETDARTFAQPLFSEVLGRSTLLPPSLLRGIHRDSVLSVTVMAPHGGEVFHSSARGFPSSFTVLDSLDEGFGRLRLAVSLRSDIAPRLVVGGLPRSRLPILMGLFALTVGLVSAAVVQLRRQQQLAQLRVDFVSGVSHELRTPLAQIRLFAELLRNGQLRSEQERERSFSIIDEEAQRLTYLVENVLAFARSEHGKNTVVAEPLAMDVEMQAAIDAFAPLARVRRAKMNATIQPALVARVDARALRQIVLNLLDNAVKYGPLGQTVNVGLSGTRDKVIIYVEDKGPGVPKAEREKVWEPYYRLGRETESAAGGSGIGLSIVGELVRLHGGRAWVEDAAAGGARFVVEFPRETHPEYESQSVEHQPAAGATA
ncbi:MAG TPA: HAMP domain-containing sensor histidine kinase [Gemmatimonadaceae bacterium]|nr:HAMP domain-containing sensor histidine kinase [Gemmatimonadaceae bacterium]